MNLLDRIHRHAVVRPQQTALAWRGGSLSYAGLAAEVEAATLALWEAGARVVALDLANGPAWVALDIAALQLDICVVPLPPFFSPEQLRHALRQAGVQLIISDDARRLRGRLGTLLEAGETPLELAGGALTAVAMRQATPADGSAPPAEVHKITFTSGTTGAPKGVMLSWAQMHRVVTSLAAVTEMDSADRHLSLMPLAVLLENVGGVYLPLWVGATSVLLPARDVGMGGSSRSEPSRMVAALAEVGATTTILTPQLLLGLVETLEANPDVRLKLRFAALGGAAVSPRLLRRAAELELPVFEGYGLSECASVVSLNGPAAHRPGSVGKPLPHVRLRIADDGLIMVGGASCAGYLAEQASAADEWPTGDLGELDADGYLYLHGRLRDVFITSYGRNVAPEWVERELSLEPAIAQAAVFGEARPYNVAVVVPAPWAESGDVAAAIARANRSLPDYARVARWAAAADPFAPANGLLTANGRIRREALARRYHPIIQSLYREA